MSSICLYRKHGSAEHEILGGFCGRDSNRLDRGGQAALRGVDAVLNVDCGEIGITIQIEGDNDIARAIVAAGRGHVLHALSAINLLLERNCDGAFDRLRAGPNVGAGYANLRRGKVRKLRDWQRRNDR